MLTYLSVGLIGILRVAIVYQPVHCETGFFSLLLTAFSFFFPADSIFTSDAWLCVQLGLSVICCCLPTYGLLSPKEKILTPVKILWSNLWSKIIAAVTGKVGSELGSSGSQKTSDLKPKSHHKDNLSVGEADEVGLTNAAEDFELGEHHFVAERDLSLNAAGMNSMVDMV